MLIIGAGGFAIQLTDVLDQIDNSQVRKYFDDTSDERQFIFDRFEIIKSSDSAYNYFKEFDNRFCLGIGNPLIRKSYFEKFKINGGVPTSVISPFSHIGKYNVIIEDGCCILTNSVIESNVHVGKGTLINLNVTITHGSIIGDFCEICPGVHISGDCTIGNQVFIGTGAVLLPKIRIGDNAKIGAGAIVIKDVANNAIVVGIPAKATKK